jgi:hypothetical protein
MNFYFQKKMMFFMFMNACFLFTTSIINLANAQERDYIEQLNQIQSIIEIESIFNLEELRLSYFCVDQNQKELINSITNSNKYEILDHTTILKVFESKQENNVEFQKCMNSYKKIYTLKENKSFFSKWETHISHCDDFEYNKENIEDQKQENQKKIKNEEINFDHFTKRISLNNKFILILKVISFVFFISFIFFFYQTQKTSSTTHT